MRFSHIYVIPDQGGIRGGDLYDKWGNLTYFADVTALVEKTSTAVNKTVNVKSHTRSRWMNDPAPFTVSATVLERTYGGGQAKGAVPGKTVTLGSDIGLPGQEIRDFQYTGTISALSAWLKTTSKMLIELRGPTGALFATIPGSTP
jgi:hypothetical protein